MSFGTARLQPAEVTLEARVLIDHFGIDGSDVVLPTSRLR
jgi:hypothetical protein